MARTTTLCLILILSFLSITYSQTNLPYPRPFRVALIIGDQWRDPTNTFLSLDNADTDVHHMAVLLKSWNIPFDIIRLDQQVLNRYMFLNHDELPKYGTIFWLVRESDALWNPDYKMISEMVHEYGINLVAFFDHIQNPVIASLLGIKYIGSWPSQAQIEPVGTHFLTQNLSGPLDETKDIVTDWQQKERIQVELESDVEVIARQGPFPQITVRELDSGTKSVWIGGDKQQLFESQPIRRLIRNCITWTIGYNLFKTWQNKAIMRMDDPGSAESNWAENWHYPTLSQETIEKYLIKPLVEHHAIMNVYVVPAFVNDGTQTLEPTWRRHYQDPYGQEQNYPSTKRGFDAGIQAGVFEIQSHGLTHMQPDLASPPSWWGAGLNQEKSHTDWYREFYDSRRQKEIPEAEQRWRMLTSVDWLKAQFDRVPLAFTAGGSGISVGEANHTIRIASRVGFGWFSFHFRPSFLTPNFVLADWQFFASEEAPLFLDILPNGHDYGITKEPEEFAKIFELYPEHDFIGMNEFIGYLHSENSGRFLHAKKSIQLSVNYDDHYCRYFTDHASIWNFELADWVQESLGSKASLTIDGSELANIKDLSKTVVLSLPGGTGVHTVEMYLKN